MVSLLALALWFAAAALFLGGAAVAGVGIGVGAFGASIWAMKRDGDLEALWGVVFVAVAVITVIRAIYALAH